MPELLNDNDVKNIKEHSKTNDMSLRIYQTPVQHLPEDLYVPPQAFAIWLEQFAGPLDFYYTWSKRITLI